VLPLGEIWRKRVETISAHGSTFLWVLCEIAIAACHLAELLGSAIALQLLFAIF
jgi:Mn2+/Fe2+ NRAMP family transporter